LFLNARAAIEMAPRAAEILGRDLGRDSAWQAEQVASFRETARNYLLS
jgi:glycerol-3-phosphate dehydrogenase